MPATTAFEDRPRVLKVRGATDWWFFPVLALVAGALILVSFGPDLFAGRGTPQAAQRDGASFIYGPHALARGVETDPMHVRHVVRDFGVSARAIRIGIYPQQAAPTPAQTGVRLLLAPGDAALMANRPLRVEISIRVLETTGAPRLSVSAQTAPPVSWVTQPILAEDGVMVFDLPASGASPPVALGFRVSSDKDDYVYGVEITRVVVTPNG